MFVRKKKNRSGSVSIVVVDKSRGRFREVRQFGVAHISQPSSKLATTSYLRSYFKEDIDLSRIYRYMDKLYNSQMELVQEISTTHTRSILGGSIGLLFYDVTTLYFEAAPKDDMRQSGFSKDGKTAEAQIVLGLLVSRDGYPLSYSIFNGSQYEGYTMIPIIDDFVSRFSLTDFVIVADSGLMSAKTIITIDVRTDGVRGVSKRTLFLTEEQKAIKQLFEMDTTKGD